MVDFNSSQSSQSVIAQELESGSAIALDVIRNGGTFGEVEVSWEVAGEGEVSPSSGTVRLLLRLFYILKQHTNGINIKIIPTGSVLICYGNYVLSQRSDFSL